jgi:hypothetical protein
MTIDDLAQRYLRGAFVAWGPGDFPTGDKLFVPFLFNPESITRQLAFDQGRTAVGAQPTTGDDTRIRRQGSDAATGALNESFTVTVRFDADVRRENTQRLAPDVGIAPDLAALENLLYAAQSSTDLPGAGSAGAVQPRPRLPEVLFIFGPGRVIPVRISGMTVRETLYNAQLFPTRAEVDVSCIVINQVDAKDSRVAKAAFEYTAAKRRALAIQFYGTVADLAGNLIPL